MNVCEHIEVCLFFNDEVGYSPDMAEAMKRRYCLGDPTDCARLQAAALVGRDNVPADMIPTDTDALERVRADASRDSY